MDSRGKESSASADDPSAGNRCSLFVPNLHLILQEGYGAAKFRNDIFGGLTAAVVALPLALAFGVASGAGPIAGLYGAIAVGFFASLFGGTPAQVSGPTGSMTVVMGAVIASHAHSLAEAFTIVLLGGLLQVLFGLLRIGKYVEHTPYSVVSGFMTGIGRSLRFLKRCLPGYQRGAGGSADDRALAIPESACLRRGSFRPPTAYARWSGCSGTGTGCTALRRPGGSHSCRRRNGPASRMNESCCGKAYSPKHLQTIRSHK